MTQPTYPLPFPRGASAQPVPSAVINGMQEWIEYVSSALASPTVVDTGYVAASGWSLSSAHAVIQGAHVDLACIVSRTGSSLPASSSGGLTDTNILTVPSSIIPPVRAHTCMLDGVGDGGGTLYGSADATPGPGIVQIRSWSANGTIASGTSMQFSFSYSLI